MIDFPIPYVKEVKLVDEEHNTPTITIVKRTINGSSGFLLQNTYGSYYVEAKGKTTNAPQPEYLLETFASACTHVEAIFDYFRKPLPLADVKEWLDWITELPTKNDALDKVDFNAMVKSTKIDNKVYRKFAKLILAGKQEKAVAFMNKQDTFVRDGVTARIWCELETPTIKRYHPLSKEKD